MDFSFISKSYEKIILVIILLFAIFSLFWIISIFTYARTERSQGKNIANNNIPYKPLPPQSYDYMRLLTDSVFWNVSSKRNSNNQDYNNTSAYTDFMNVYPIARSYIPKAQGKCIPYASYKDGTCPITYQKLSLPQVKTEEIIVDTNNNGLPDIVAKYVGLNMAKTTNADIDSNNNSFTNLQKYQYNPESITTPHIHPPFIKRLVIESISSTEIPILLKNVIDKGDDKDSWDVQVNADEGNNKWKTLFLQIGSHIQANNIDYKIKDIISKKEETIDPKLGGMIEKNVSELVLIDNYGNEIILQMNTPAYEPHKIVIVKDLYDDKNYSLRINDKITLGNDELGFETYMLAAINQKNKTAEFEKEGRRFIVSETTEYKVPSKNG